MKKTLILLSMLLTNRMDAAGDYSWQKTDHSVALLIGTNRVWQHNHDPAEGKPYIHPLSTTDGEVLSGLRPDDHPWHRAGWFSWKIINGLNYWEEDRKTGLSQGRTEILDVQVKTTRRHSAEIQMTLIYHPPDQPEILSEKRIVSFSKPDKSGAYTMDWESTFTASGGEVEFARTPIPGEKGGMGHGGYAGFSIRMAQATRGWSFVSSEGLEGKALHGQNANWVSASGKTASGEQAGLAIFDHPSNMRHPNAWYLAEQMPYLSPAVIFNAPHRLNKNESFTLRYRVLVHSGPRDAAALNKAWTQYAK